VVGEVIEISGERCVPPSEFQYTGLAVSGADGGGYIGPLQRDSNPMLEVAL
jgi:hypothetical protein